MKRTNKSPHAAGLVFVVPGRLPGGGTVSPALHQFAQQIVKRQHAGPRQMWVACGLANGINEEVLLGLHDDHAKTNELARFHALKNVLGEYKQGRG